jgi:hypothetical protein
MTPELVQDGTVTLIAIAAAAVILRRVLALVPPPKSGHTACSSCASAQRACAAREQLGTPGEPVHVQLLRGSPSHSVPQPSGSPLNARRPRDPL